MSEHLIREAQGRWRGILTEIGISADRLTNRKGPCPICGGKDRFRFDDKDGSGSWYCNGCGAGYGVHLVARWTRAPLSEAWDKVAVILGSGDIKVSAPPRVKSTVDHAREAWRSGSVPIEGSPVDRFLHGRGVPLTVFPRSIRTAERLYLDEDGEFLGKFPAMLALVSGADGKPAGVHVTFLTREGRKADVPTPRKVLGKMPEGAAVRLQGYGQVLGIAEGIETALAASKLFETPCWAALTAGAMEKWKAPDDVEEVVIFGDHDQNFRGQAAAYTLAHKIALQRKKVRIELPAFFGDWNDVLKKGSTR